MKDIKLFSLEGLKNVNKLVRAVNRIRQELRDEGTPIDEYERIFINGEDPSDVFRFQELSE